jgi:hypothetical protein
MRAKTDIALHTNRRYINGGKVDPVFPENAPERSPPGNTDKTGKNFQDEPTGNNDR